VVVDHDMQVPPACVAIEMADSGAKRLLARLPEPANALDVEMDQLPGPGVLVALSIGTRLRRARETPARRSTRQTVDAGRPNTAGVAPAPSGA
jgi:hypothetical protein